MADTICAECHKAICKCVPGEPRTTEWGTWSDPHAIRNGGELTIASIERALQAIKEQQYPIREVRWNTRDVVDWIDSTRYGLGALPSLHPVPLCHCAVMPAPAGACFDCAADYFNFWAQIAIAGLLQITKAIDYALTDDEPPQSASSLLGEFVYSQRMWETMDCGCVTWNRLKGLSSSCNHHSGLED